ncbi:hypothetical protein BC940DRAFT_305495 [Gongronella butleri]|nr:hypothetical protein BC940DRAFT_305495 [Gongronella butleri]
MADDSSSQNATPLLGVLQTIRRTANRDFESIHDYVSNIFSPRRSQGNTTVKTAVQPQDRQPQVASPTPVRAPRPTHREEADVYSRSPSSRSTRSRPRVPDYPPPRAMTLTPSSVRSQAVSLTSDTLTSSHPGTPERHPVRSQEQQQAIQHHGQPRRPSTPMDHTRRSSRSRAVQASSGARMDSPVRRTSLATMTPDTRLAASYTSPYASSSSGMASPSRGGTYSPVTAPGSPSAVLHDRLVDESRRLDQLQRDMAVIKQQSVILASYASPTRPPAPSNTSNTSKTSNTPDSRLSPRRTLLRSTSASFHDNTLPDRHASYASSPRRPPKRAHSSLGLTSPSPLQNRIHPVDIRVPPPPAISSTKSQRPPRPPSPLPQPPAESPRPSKHRRVAPFDEAEKAATMNNLLGDLSKAKLKSTQVVQTPNGSRVRNRFWDEIHGSSSDGHERAASPSSAISRTNPRSLAPRTPLAPAMANSDPLATRPRRRSSHGRRSGKETKSLAELERDEAAFWLGTTQDEQHSALTHRLTQTLNDEMLAAQDKDDTKRAQDHRNRIQSRSFALQPKKTPNQPFHDELASSVRNRKHQIDGDEWTFAGQHYVVNEKRPQS